MIGVRPGDLLGGRYLLLSPLGEGASGVVFRATDRWAERDVAVKLLAGEGAVAAARRELDVSRAHHPAVAQAIDVGRAGNAAYVVLELADGAAFDAALAAADASTVAAAVDGLLDALSLLHAAGLVHGDLKPDNVRVAFEAGRPRVRLLDLGMVRPEGTSGGGNTTYGAPEILGGRVSRASDLFSVGVMAYEALEGRLPFGSEGDAEYLSRLARAEVAPFVRAKKRRGAPAEGGSGDPACDEDAPLEAFVLRLLGRESSTRYPSAPEARAALRDAVDLPPAEPVVVSPPLVERGDQLAQLQALVARWVRGEAVAARIVGEAGTGRTTLLRRAAAEARLAGIATIEVSAADGAPALLDGIVQGAIAFGAGAAGERAGAALRQGPRDHQARFGPWLEVVRALDAAAAHARVVVAVDDADRADDETAEVLRFLAAGEAASAEAGTRPMWIRTAAPSSESAGAEPLDEGVVVVSSCAITEPGLVAMIGAMLPGIDGAPVLARRAWEATSGVARDVVDGVHDLVRRGDVRFLETAWRTSAEGLASDAFEAARGRVVAARIGSFSGPVQHAIGAAALAGLDLRTVGELLGLAPDAIERAEGTGVAAGVLRRGLAGTVIASAELAADIASQLAPPDRVRLCIALVDALRTAPDVRVRAARPDLLMRLGDEDQAIDDAIETAERAAEQGLARLAVSLLERARAWGGARVAGRTAGRRAELLAALGDLPRALAVLDGAGLVGIAAHALTAVRGCVLARAGRYDEAIDALWGSVGSEHPRGVRAEGAGGPRTSNKDARFWLAWSLMMRGRYEEAIGIAEAPSHDARQRARMMRVQGTASWHRGRADEAAALLSRSAEEAMRSGDSMLQAEAMLGLGTAERMRGALDEAARHLGEAVRIARSHGYAPLLAKCLNNLAIAEYQAGRWERARHAWESMQDLAARLGSHEEVLLSHNNLGLLYRDRGELERAERSLGAALALAKRHGLSRYEAMATGNRADVRILKGDLDAAARDLDDAESLASALAAEDELVECARRRASIAHARGDHARAMRDAKEAALGAKKIGAHVERALALIVVGSAAREMGRRTEARLAVDGARKALDAGGTRLERARVDLEDARLRAVSDDPAGARRLAQRAAEVFAELGAQSEHQAARAIEHGDTSTDRNDALVALLRFAAQARDVSSLVEGVLDRVLDLTAAERGYIVMLAGDAGPHIAARRAKRGSDEPLPMLSRGIADRVIASKKPLVLADIGDSLELATRDSVVDLGLRAALCAPLMRGDRCLGLLYVDSREAESLMRLGPWVMDAVCALVVPALERLEDRQRDADRAALLSSAAVDALGTIAAIDAALELVADEDDPDRRAELVARARGRAGALSERSKRLLDLLRLDRGSPGDDEATSVTALLGCAVDVFRRAPFRVCVEARDEGWLVAGELERLAAVVAGMVELAGRRCAPGAAVTLRTERTADDHAREDLAAWRPGETAGRAYVRIAASVASPARASGEPESASEALAQKAARRVVRRAGGRLFEAHEDGVARWVLELPIAETPAPAATPARVPSADALPTEVAA